MPIDYSKFDAVIDSDEEMEKEVSAKENSSDKPKHCANCHETPAKPVRCAVCKTTLYCNQNCQKNDWRFHKRICKKSDDKMDVDQNNVKSKPSDDKTTPKVTKNDVSAPPKTTISSTKKPVAEKDDEENEKIDWYRHRETKLPSCPNSAPKKITNAEDTRPSPPEKGSVWNAAGTWEEKDVTKWADDEITKRCTTEVSCKFGLIRTSSVVNKGDASITVIRGQTRYLFDFSITIHWESRISSAMTGTDITVKGELHCAEFADGSDVASLEFEVQNISSTPKVEDKRVLGIIDELKQSAKTEFAKKVRENLASFAVDLRKFGK